MTGQSQLPMDTWVDGQKRVRRVALQMPVCTAVGTFSESISMDIFDYGRQPAVAAPDPSQVTDVTSQITARASQSLQQLGSTTA